MQMKSLLSAGLGAFALGLVTTAAQAGPSGFGGAIDQSAGRSGLVEKVTWYRDGHYGHYHRPYYNYGWYGHRHTATATTAIAGTASAITGGISVADIGTGSRTRGRPGARSGDRPTRAGNAGASLRLGARVFAVHEFAFAKPSTGPWSL